MLSRFLVPRLSPQNRRQGVAEPLEALLQSFEGIFDESPSPWMTDTHYDAVGYCPNVDVREFEGTILVSAEVPGLSHADLDVTLSSDGRILLIAGEKRPEYPDAGEDYYRMERVYGRFQRYLILPTAVCTDEVVGVVKDGVFTISLVKCDVGPAAKQVTVLAA